MWTKRLGWIAAGAVALLTLAGVAGAEEAAQAAQAAATGWGKAIGAAIAIGLPAIGTGYAQARIGAAGAGALAERPEVAGSVTILVAIPETAVVLGLVIAALIIFVA